jgi:hypothetical protein
MLDPWFEADLHIVEEHAMRRKHSARGARVRRGFSDHGRSPILEACEHRMLLASTVLFNPTGGGFGSGEVTASPSNNTATDTDTPSPKVDLAITKTDGTTTYSPGTTPFGLEKKHSGASVLQTDSGRVILK